MGIIVKPQEWERPDLEHPSMEGAVLVLPLTGNVDDYSGQKNNGTNDGAEWVSGPALRFDGTTGVSFGTPANLLVTNVTIIARFRYSSLTGFQHIYGAEFSRGVWFAKQSNNGRMTFWINNNSWQQVGPDIPVDTWRTIAFTYDGTTRIMYEDGVFVDSNTGVSGNITWGGATDIRLGNTQAGAFDFIGDIEYCRVLPFALSAAAIRQIADDPWGEWRRDNIALWASQGGAPPVGAYMPQLQMANLGAKLYQGTLVA